MFYILIVVLFKPATVFDKIFSWYGSEYKEYKEKNLDSIQRMLAVPEILSAYDVYDDG